jgi:4-diphosphocytidyl-2-C-methyl-D-erythritol kinase
MISFPKAKINLGLRITRKRSDGYHDIETLFYPVGLCDALEFVVSEDHSEYDLLTVTGIEPGGDPADNLIIKTVKKLREKYSFPVLKIHLHKVIPVGAGLGGGSSDAACFLKTLNKYFKLFLNDELLKEISLELGSDCPFFIDCIPSHAIGRGEILDRVRPILKGYYLLLMNPGVRVNTREAYQNCQPQEPQENLVTLINLPITQWKGLILNDFEDNVFRKHPLIGEIKDELYKSGALFSLMSGSGSSVYGIFSERPEIPRKLKEYLIWEGVM